MRRWTDRLRFLWEEETTPREEASARNRGEPSGVPRPLRLAARFAMIAVVATSLMSQVVGVRLIAPVDAAPSYRAQCEKGCNDTNDKCKKDCGKAYQDCQKQIGADLRLCQKSCNGLRGQARDLCIRSCNETYGKEFRSCQQKQNDCFPACEKTAKQCRANCKKA